MEAGDELSVNWKTTYIKHPFSCSMWQQASWSGCYGSSLSPSPSVCVRDWLTMLLRWVFKKIISNHCAFKWVNGWEGKSVNKSKSDEAALCSNSSTLITAVKNKVQECYSSIWTKQKKITYHKYIKFCLNKCIHELCKQFLTSVKNFNFRLFSMAVHALHL